MKQWGKKKTMGTGIEDDSCSESPGSSASGESLLEQESEGAGVVAEAAEKSPASEVSKPGIEEELQEQKGKYLRLYADFENYKKRVIKDKEELIKYGGEALIYELLPVIDNLEMALKHSSDGASSASSAPGEGEGLVQGVEITLKEFLKVLGKFGLVQITGLGKAFDPSLHHAMAQVERDDADENIVVEEFRKGYMLKDKVLRPSLVAVSKKTARSDSVSEEMTDTEY